MLYVTGDIHGDVRALLNWLDHCKIPHSKNEIIIMLGDVGVNYFGDYRDQEKKVMLQDSNRTYFCIHGNHERRPDGIATYRSVDMFGGSVYVEDEYSNLIFAKDGEVYDLEGLRTLVLGGAYSVDKWYRLQNGWNWFADEQIPVPYRKVLLNKFKMMPPVDLVLSHTCPYEWMPTDLFLSSIDQSRVDNSTEHWLSEVEKTIDYRCWLFGHFHDDRKINSKAIMLYKNVMDLNFLRANHEN